MWGVGLGVNDVPIVGEPIAYGAGFLALLFVGFSTYIGRYFYFYVTAGGSLLVRVGLAQRIEGFWLYGQSAVVGNEVRGGGGWPTLVLVALARYLGPSLLGLGGAALIASGNPWAVLLSATFLSILALLVVAAFASAGAFAADDKDKKAANVTGTWKWTVAGRDGNTYETVAKLKQDGEKVTGTVTGRQGNETEITNGKVKGDQLSFTLEREFNGTKVTLKHSGKVDGDSIKGKIEMERDGQTPSRDWEAKRAKDDKAGKAA